MVVGQRKVWEGHDFLQELHDQNEVALSSCDEGIFLIRHIGCRKAHLVVTIVPYMIVAA